MASLFRLRLRFVLALLLLLQLCAFSTAFRLTKGHESRNLGLAQNLITRNEGRPSRIAHGRLASPTALNAAKRFKNFEQVLDTFREEAVIIYFSTTKCGPCQLMKKEVLAIKQAMGEEMKMFSVDTEKWPSVGSRFEVARLPCLVVFREGEIKLRMEGVNRAEAVVKEVRTFL